ARASFLSPHVATSQIHSLSLHDALPISLQATDAELIDAALEAASSYNVNARGAIHVYRVESLPRTATGKVQRKELSRQYTESVGDRKSTRLNSSHVKISYAVFCLKKKKQ